MRILLVLCVLLMSALSPSLSTADTRGDDDGARVVRGPSRTIGRGHAFAWVKIDRSFRPHAIGVTLSKDALTGLPETIREYTLTLPLRVAPYNHIGIDWNPMGHEPSHVYDLPHFDFHFYWISKSARQKISCTGPDLKRCEKSPEEDTIPTDYVSTPGGVPQMGAHWIDPTSPEFNGQPFTMTFIYGSYDGHFTFAEPMVSRDFLLLKPDISIPVKSAPRVERDGYYPRHYEVIYDGKSETYTIALTELTFRRAEK